MAVGCTELATLDMYKEYIEKEFPDRRIFVIQGDVSFKRRQSIIKQFEDTLNGILLCTQQSLKSSANVPTCDDVILESLQWNIPKMELVLTKERLNEFIKNGEVMELSAIFEEFEISMSVIESLLVKTHDDKGKVHVSWGSQRIVA